MRTTRDDELIAFISRNDWISRIIVCLGGIAAEELVFGHWNMGGEDDFDVAVAMAELAAADLSFDNSLKTITDFRINRSKKPTVEYKHTVTLLMEACKEAAVQVLAGNMNTLQDLAKELESREDLAEKEVDLYMQKAAIDAGKTIDFVIQRMKHTQKENV